MVRVRGFRPLNWDYFYNVNPNTDVDTVLPLVTLYRKLGKLRGEHPALRAPRENYKEEYFSSAERVLVYSRWTTNDILITALNFSDYELYVPVPF